MNIRTALTTLASTAALTLGGLVLTPAPAQAIGSDVVCAESLFGRAGGVIRTCLQVNFGKQADGSGVQLRGYGVTTDAGCWRMEDPYPYEDLAFGFVNPRSGNIKYSTSGDSMFDCNEYTGVTRRGADKGRMLVRWSGDVRVDLGTDRRHGIGIYIYPDGSSEKAYTYAVNDESRAMGKAL